MHFVWKIFIQIVSIFLSAFCGWNFIYKLSAYAWRFCMYFVRILRASSRWECQLFPPRKYAQNTYTYADNLYYINIYIYIHKMHTKWCSQFVWRFFTQNADKITKTLKMAKNYYARILHFISLWVIFKEKDTLPWV